MTLSEVVTRRRPMKKLFQNISQNCQENTYSQLFSKVAAKEILAHVISCEFWELFKSTFVEHHKQLFLNNNS